ncbi:hypothetical protein [Corynebacterium alimapuense]|uniref:hypothetical protein n=1 Tax=Corynebacterium alimapuense TaxID=1576874 RepID=UPI000F8099F3|nr:hypothetical protein [Corynebacterium alimapuense]
MDTEDELIAAAGGEELIAAAGGEEEIIAAAELAASVCHRSTAYNDVPIQLSPYIANEFQGAYIEEGGRYIRHVIAGTIDVQDSHDSVIPVGYSCAYLQRQTTDAPAAQDNLGTIVEEEAVSFSAGGDSLATLRDILRNFHGVGEGETEIVLSTDSYETATAKWRNAYEQEIATPTASPESYDGPLEIMLDGTYLIGSDVVPGTYRAEEAGTSCYWARLSGLSGETSDIIANDSRAVSPVVMLLESDVAFQSSNCGLWTMIS